MFWAFYFIYSWPSVADEGRIWDDKWARWNPWRRQCCTFKENQLHCGIRDQYTYGKFGHWEVLTDKYICLCLFQGHLPTGMFRTLPWAGFWQNFSTDQGTFVRQSRRNGSLTNTYKLRKQELSMLTNLTSFSNIREKQWIHLKESEELEAIAKDLASSQSF